MKAQENFSRTKWFTDARFGLFIHWGLYSMPARHEWVRNKEKISNEEYQKYFEHFNPDPMTLLSGQKKLKMPG